MIERKLARDIRRTPTAKTLAYVQGLIAFKRTHIDRELHRLHELEVMESELLAVLN